MNAEDMAEMALRLHDEPGSVETVERVCAYALKAIDCDYAGVILWHKKTQTTETIETITATDPLIETLDQMQIDIAQGPGIDTLNEHPSIIVSDITLETRWPRWTRAIAAAGIRSVLTTRLHTSKDVLGILNLYSKTANKFDIDDRAVAHVIARHAAVAIATARNEGSHWHAVDARKLIGQAQGILMQRYDLDPDRAFHLLVRCSQDHNIKLRDLAQTLVETRKLPS